MNMEAVPKSTRSQLVQQKLDQPHGTKIEQVVHLFRVVISIFVIKKQDFLLVQMILLAMGPDLYLVEEIMVRNSCCSDGMMGVCNMFKVDIMFILTEVKPMGIIFI